jgi:hypothetical protein
MVFGNRERVLPASPGYYREYTVDAGARDRGRRIVCGGASPPPDACFTPRPLRELRDRVVSDDRFFGDLRRNATMLLQTVRPNIVQSIRAYRVEDLQQAAQDVGQHFLYANLTTAQSKQEVLDSIAESFLFPGAFGKNLDCAVRLHDRPRAQGGQQPGFVVVLEQLPGQPALRPRGTRAVARCLPRRRDFWAERKIPFRCFYSFQ